MKKERLMGLDVARCIAILAVLMIHVSSEFVKVPDRTSSLFFWGNIFDSVSRLAVPLFVMISGALMLDERRTMDIRSFYKKNGLGLFLLLIVWEFIYALIFSLKESNGLSTIFQRMIQGHYHLWYMYLIISLYIVTPFLRCIVKKENKRLVELFLVIAFLTQFTKPLVSIATSYLPFVKYLKQFMDHFYMGFFANYTAYYILGWYITHIGVMRKGFVYILGLGAIITTMTYTHMTGDYDRAYTSMSLMILMYSVACFTWVMSQRWRYLPWVVHLSKISFGIYLIHPLVLKGVQLLLPAVFMPPVTMLIQFVLTMAISWGLCLIISKIPYVRNVIRM